jgi:predicted ribosomally synthesized peptide with nif11-like leader
MSKQEVERFSKDVVNSKDLQDKVAAVGGISELVSLAKQQGYDFSADELQDYVKAQKAELSVDELDKAAAGGMNTHAAVVVINAGALVVLGH